jgi:glycosyltransferase involved in cell wall biosynthesis
LPDHVDPALGAHLILAGPAVTGVAGDPDAAKVYDCVERWRQLPHAIRGRVHLACVPMTDPDEAAAIVNALQRHATVVVQKSIAEGFGLTVAEAMWKSRPIVASAVGGIRDQITDGSRASDRRSARSRGLGLKRRATTVPSQLVTRLTLASASRMRYEGPRGLRS